MDAWAWQSWIWAQAPAGTDPAAVKLIALRRWYTGLTLSSPEAVPSRVAVLAWLGGLAALLLLAIVCQGPRRALGQAFDVAGLTRLARAGVARLRSAGRLVAILLGTTVLAWTASQALNYSREERKDDVAVLLRAKSLRELSLEQGVLAALTPLRDLLGLGDNLLLLLGAATLVFKLSADRWGMGALPPEFRSVRAAPGWTTLCWGAAWLYALYRVASLVVEGEGLPLGGCLFIEAGVVPLLMILADSLVLAWVLIELRAGGRAADAEGIDVVGAVALVPAAAVACLLALPARYIAAGAWLLLVDVPGLATTTGLPYLVGGWGLVILQGAALLTAGVAGAAAWSGSVGSALAGYGRMLRAEGGRLVGLLAAAGLAAGGLSALAYAVVLALPSQPWVLPAADGYAHYATLPVGLVTLAALVELGARSLPTPPEPAAVEAEATVA